MPGPVDGLCGHRFCGLSNVMFDDVGASADSLKLYALCHYTRKRRIRRKTVHFEGRNAGGLAVLACAQGIECLPGPHGIPKGLPRVRAGPAYLGIVIPSLAMRR
jgi:hypothetical protein